LNQTLTQTFFFLIKSLTKLLKLVNRIKLHGTLICWVENILKHLCKATSVFEFNQISIEFQLSSFLLFFFFFSFLSTHFAIIFSFVAIIVMMFVDALVLGITFFRFAIFLRICYIFKEKLVKLCLSLFCIIVLSH